MNDPRPRFRVSRINIVLMVLALGLSLAIAIRMYDGSPEAMGRVAAAVIGAVVLTLLFGWLAFLISGRRLLIGSLVMSVWMCLSITTSVKTLWSGTADPVPEDEFSAVLPDEINSLRADYRDAETKEDRESAARDIQEKLARIGIQGTAENGPRGEAIAAYMERQSSNSERWSSAKRAFANAEVFDFDAIDGASSSNAYDTRRNACQTLRQDAVNHQRHAEANTAELVKDLQALLGEDPGSKGFLTGFQNGRKGVAAMMKQQNERWIAYADTVVSMLDHLQKSDWKAGQNGPAFDDPDAQVEHNRFVDELIALETEIEKLEIGSIDGPDA